MISVALAAEFAICTIRWHGAKLPKLKVLHIGNVANYAYNVGKVLQTPALRQQWADELTAMRERIKVMRQRLYDGVVAKLPGRDVRYFIDQRGMFSYTGVSPEQAETLRTEHGVYVLRSGRMCAAGLNANNVDRVAEAFAAVLAKG